MLANLIYKCWPIITLVITINQLRCVAPVLFIGPECQPFINAYTVFVSGIRIRPLLMLLLLLNISPVPCPLTYLCVFVYMCLCVFQGGRCWGTAGPAVPERSGSSPKGRTPNIRYFVAKLSIVAIYALYEWPP